MNEHRRALLKALALSPLVALTWQPVSAATDLLEVFRKKYADLRSVSFTFSSTTAKGTVKAQRGNKHRIVLPDRTLVSNGTYAWNAVNANKTVVSERIKPRQMETSLDKIFFLVFATYTASVVGTTSTGGTIRLVPPDASMKIGTIDKLDLVVTNKGIVTSILVYEGGMTTKWKITKLKVNPKFDASTFEYSVPKGWQEIDLR